MYILVYEGQSELYSCQTQLVYTGYDVILDVDPCEIVLITVISNHSMSFLF